jgi:hypothetical protein
LNSILPATPGFWIASNYSPGVRYYLRKYIFLPFCSLEEKGGGICFSGMN